MNDSFSLNIWWNLNILRGTTLPLAERVEDFHLQVVFPTTTAFPTAPVTARRAVTGAPNEKRQSQFTLPFDFVKKF